jgi:hypothetical protein
MRGLVAMIGFTVGASRVGSRVGGGVDHRVDIARLLGDVGTAVTKTVYRHQLRPVLVEGAETMDEIFPEWLDGS